MSDFGQHNDSNSNINSIESLDPSKQAPARQSQECFEGNPEVTTTEDIPRQQPNDFREYLKMELEKRCQKNPQFSLRGFARILEIEPSSLSKLINGKRRITKNMFHRLSTKLSLTPQELKDFYQKVSEKNK